MKAMIENLQVTSNAKYIVFGNVRGLVSEHRTLSAAQRSLAADQRGCKAQGQGHYSDARIYTSTLSDSWTLVVD
jgi:hypothetical protein